jgi:large subunit ribosomal protein L28
MSKVCSICGKKPSTGYKVSHSQRHTKRRWMPNLQAIRIKTAAGNRRRKVCTACIKAGKIEKAG